MPGTWIIGLSLPTTYQIMHTYRVLCPALLCALPCCSLLHDCTKVRRSFEHSLFVRSWPMRPGDKASTGRLGHHMVNERSLPLPIGLSAC